MLTHLSLFTGIGGLDLAAEAAGFVTVGQCEWADYPTKVLEKHWPDVPRWRDIRTLTGADFYERTGLRTVDVISGGFPCQPFSVAGKRKGKEDDRYLWPEMLRVISEIRPTWVIGENVPGIINLALDTVLSDLESIGYSCQTFVVPACGVDAPHRRYRVAVVANRMRDGGETGIADQTRRKERKANKLVYRSKNMAYTNSDGCSKYKQKFEKRRDDDEIHPFIAKSLCDRNGGWPAEPDVGRVANGVPHRVDRLRCLGNAVVPPQFYPFFHFIAQIESE